MAFPRKFLQIAVPTGVGLIIILVAAKLHTIEERGIPHSNGPGMTAARPECPEVWYSIPLFQVDSNVTGGTGDSTAVRTATGGGRAIVGMSGLALSGPNTNIPEFNDCQKFIEVRGNERTYGSLVAIFAASTLDDIINSLITPRVTWTSTSPTVASVSSDGVVRALASGTTTASASPMQGSGGAAGPRTAGTATIAIVVASGRGTETPSDLSITPGAPVTITLAPGQTVRLHAFLGPPTTSTLAVGEIYNYGDTYGPLGIHPNFSCLYLYFDQSGVMRAKMAPTPALGTAWNACATAADPTQRIAGEKELSIVRSTGGNPADYPAVARWDWDPVNNQQSIGIKCGDGWCQLGGAGPNGTPFAPSLPADVSGPLTPGEQSVVRVKGWYDEQYLGAGIGLGSIKPTTIKGTIYPIPDLHHVDWDRFENGTSGDPWVRVAYVALRGQPSDAVALRYYAKKLNLEPTPERAPLARMNQLFQCFGTRAYCGVPDNRSAACGPDYKFGVLSLFPIRRWWSKIVSVSGNAQYRCVTRRYDPNMPPTLDIPGTTRWRWIVADETTWNDCVLGCCEEGGLTT